MIMVGRPPKPTAIKILEGNRGRRKLNENEPQPRGDIPNCPSFLTKGAREEWRRMMPILESARVMTAADMACLAGYCQAYGRWKEAEEELKKIEKKRDGNSGILIKTSNGNVIQNPLLGIINRQLMIMNRFSTELGITPSSRSRIVVGNSEEESNSILD